MAEKQAVTRRTDETQAETGKLSLPESDAVRTNP